MATEKIDLSVYLRNQILKGRVGEPPCLPSVDERWDVKVIFIDLADVEWMFGRRLSMKGDFDYIYHPKGDAWLLQTKVMWLWMKEV